MTKKTIQIFHRELTDLENDKEENIEVNRTEEEQLLGFCFRIIKLLNIPEIEKSLGISNAMLKNIQQILR